MSSDEWMSDNESEDTFFGSNEPSKAFVAYNNAETIPKDLNLLNFLDTGAHFILNRCEPVNKMYPSVHIPERLRKYKSLVISMMLYHHDCETVDVRCPDLKDKIQLYRNHHGVWIDPSSNSIVRMKKKAINQVTKRDTAFRLSTDFKFHTNGIEPTFVFAAIPFENGKFVYEDASLSKPFFVRSKRQERHTNTSRKRRKKGVEILKINTEILSAREQLEQLKTRLAQLKSQNGEYVTLFSDMRRYVGEFNPTTNIALDHAFRGISTTDSVTL
tara:strand:- start:5691 stop:6506 length:816 start_codon:yes stop_codon:yes gene_type:complete